MDDAAMHFFFQRQMAQRAPSRPPPYSSGTKEV